jgi:hypothetical protein
MEIARYISVQVMIIGEQLTFKMYLPIDIYRFSKIQLLDLIFSQLR